VLGIRSVALGRKMRSKRRKKEEENGSGDGNGSNGTSWSSEDAHAKWGVVLSDLSSFSFACVGDTNRDAPDRAGGAACVRWPGLARFLEAAVEKVDACGEERASDKE
jgi:hypothetical protein